MPKIRLLLFEKAWLLAPILIWFSYRPLFHLGKNSSTNFELSITLIYLSLLALSGLPLIWQSRKKLLVTHSVWVVGIFVLTSGVSIFWTSNIVRGLVTIGVIGLLYVVFLASLSDRDQLRRLIPLLFRLYIASALLMGFLSLAQVVAGIWFTQNQTLLCSGCLATQFGFSRPNVFTVEPQFLGSLLLVPIIVLTHNLLIKKQNKLVLVSFFIISTTLFLTLSRGAIFAYSIGLLVLLFTTRPTFQNLSKTLAVLSMSFVICLLIQGFAAVANPKINSTFYTANRTSVNQLSLGVINLPAPNSPKSTPIVIKSQIDTRPILETLPNEVIPGRTFRRTTPNYKGYVKQSTSVRLKLTRIAIHAWARSPYRAVFGIGLGGSGVTLRRDYPDQVNDYEIVQNEFAEILLENGLLGIVSFTLIIGGLTYSLRDKKWLEAIVAAFLGQWYFFSGYPNSLHIYLLLIILYISLDVAQRSESSKIAANLKRFIMSRMRQLNQKALSITLVIFLGLLAYMPLHIFLSTLIGANVGGLAILKVLKDVVALIGFMTVLAISLRKPWFKGWIRQKLVILIVVYTSLTVLMAVIKPTDQDAEILGVAYNLRFPMFLLYGWLLSQHLSVVMIRAKAIKTVLASSIVVVLFGIFQYVFLPNNALTHLGFTTANGVFPVFFIDNKPDLERVMSTLRDPNSLGSYLIIILSLITAKLATGKKKQRRLLAIYGLATILCLLFTFSRSALLGLVATVVLGLVYASHRFGLQRYTRSIGLVLGIGIILSTGGLVVARNTYFVRNTIFHSDAATVEEDPNQLRLRFFKESIQDIKDNPVGRGPGTAGLASIKNKIQGTVLTENYYLQIAIEVGVVGLLLFLAILILVYRRLLFCKSDPAVIALIASFTGLAVTNLLVHIWSNEAVAYTWWGLAGLYMTVPTSENLKQK